MKSLRQIMSGVFLVSLFGCSFLIFSCKPVDPNKQVDEGKVANNTYTSEDIGWTIAIPQGWSITEKDKSEEYQDKGLEIIGEVVDGEIDISGLKNLISFEKDEFNVFQSTSEPFKVEYNGEWEVTNTQLKKILHSAYTGQGIKVDSSATSTVIIDGLEFRHYSFTIYDPNGDTILNQLLYSRLMHGLDFGVNINYNNEQDKTEMLAAWNNSKFVRK
jgi:hypothetical protein